MDRIGKRVEARVEATVREYASDILTNLIIKTPILSGQAKANWQIGIGDKNDVFIELREAVKRKEPDLDDVADALSYGLAKIQEYKLDNTIHIFNNAPYIVRLNEGYSPQAPAGFVDDVFKEAGKILKKAGGL